MVQETDLDELQIVEWKTQLDAEHSEPEAL